MKKIILSMVILLTAVTGIQAMSYQQARDQALFLTDKMAYELNMNEQQYEAAYEINLDYLMGVTTVDDVYSTNWRQRNADLRYVLMDWQYTAFCAATYFFRPLYWTAGNWHFGVYAHYPHHDFFYFNRPSCYMSYRGAHSWRGNGGISWYMHRSNTFRSSGRAHVGLRDNYRGGNNRGGAYSNGGGRNDFRDNRPGVQTQMRGNRGSYGSQNTNDRRTYTRESSTRTTVGTNDAGTHNNGFRKVPSQSANRGSYGSSNGRSTSANGSGSRSFSANSAGSRNSSGSSFRNVSGGTRGNSATNSGRR